jgi:hypothetical protein
MTRNLLKRLQKLESQLPQEPPQLTVEQRRANYWDLIEKSAIGYYLGVPNFVSLDGKDKLLAPPMDAYAKVLGYSDFRQWVDAATANDPNLPAREFLAKVKLYAKFGVDWPRASEADRLEALKRMRDGLPESDPKCAAEVTGYDGD